MSYNQQNLPTSPNRGPSGYNRRSNSARRDVRMKNRRNSPNGFSIAIIIIVLLVLVGVIVTLVGIADRPKSGNTLPPAQTGTTAAPSETTLPPETTQPPVTTPPETTPPTTLAPETTAPPETTPPESAPPVNVVPPETDPVKIYEDSPAPGYVGDNPNWETIHYEWELQNGQSNMYIDLPLVFFNKIISIYCCF